MKKRILSILLSVLLVLGTMPAVAVPVVASGQSNETRLTVSFIDENGEESEAENCIKMASSEAVDDFSFEAGEWYVVNGTYTVNNRIENNAPADNPAHLILGYGAVLNANMGIHNPEGKGLIIFTHSESVPGTLVADTPRKPVNFNSNAGIGGNSREAGGNLMICGGDISAIGGYKGGAGIGGGYGGNGGSITITGGTVTAIGGEADGGAGIGGGSYGGAGGNITITGGKVTAKGLTMSAGIGGGIESDGGNVTITSGEVIAQGSVAPAIGAGYDGANNGKFILGEGLDMFVGFSPKYSKYQIYQLYAYTLDYYVEIIGSPSYTVKHLKQNDDKTGYETAETETLTGHTGDKTTASFKSYDGFIPLVFEQQTIKKDSSAVVEIYYNKIAPSHEHTFSPDWSFDETKHWYAATCEHTELTKGLEKHTFGDGVTEGNKATYTCPICRYEKVVITQEDEAAKALAEAKTAAKAVIDDAVKSADNDIKNYASAAKGDIDKLTTITAVTEKLTSALAEINNMRTAKAITAALLELDNVAKNAVANKSKAIAKAAKPLIENAGSGDEANAVLAEALTKIAGEEKTLQDAKTAAKAVIDSAAGSKQSTEMKKIVSETKTAIDNAKSTEEVENAKQAGLKRIEAQKQAEKPIEPTNPDVCPKCGGTHPNNFWGQIVCFFNRIGNWFRNLFK